MRKKFINNQSEIEEIIQQAQICYLALADDNVPYVVPMNFGYENGIFYLHSGKPGRKLEILRKNNQACIALDTDSELNFVSENTACSYSMKYKSVVARGRILFIDDYEQKIRYMNIIMKHYTGRDFTYNRPAIENVEIFIMKPDELTAINRGYC